MRDTTEMEMNEINWHIISSIEATRNFIDEHKMPKCLSWLDCDAVKASRVQLEQYEMAFPEYFDKD